MSKRGKGTKGYIHKRLNLLKPNAEWLLGKRFNVTMTERSDILYAKATK